MSVVRIDRIAGFAVIRTGALGRVPAPRRRGRSVRRYARAHGAEGVAALAGNAPSRKTGKSFKLLQRYPRRESQAAASCATAR